MNATSFTGTIEENDGITTVKIARLKNLAQTQNGFELTEKTVKGSLQIIKKDGLSVSMLHGNATLENTQFDVINKSKAPVYY
ncbi:hypothetical protein FE83_15020, partial [Staphylococcus aureus]